MRAIVRVTGIVQGIGFRPFIYRIATKNNLKGYVSNLRDAGVEILIEGKESDIKNFLEELKSRAPPFAGIDSIKVDKYPRVRPTFNTFKIIKSKRKLSEDKQSIIPPDISICEDCLEELRDPNDRRYRYFFITCTNCGPRYTIIENLPYDRERTSMIDFPMCPDCEKEYTDPLNRRFHAQTVACHKCGPKAFLIETKTGKKLNLNSIDSIQKAAKVLAKGKIVAIKGNGGFHIACSASNGQAILKIRKSLGRSQQPFAIMVKDLSIAKKIAYISRKEEEILKSYIRPILVLNKKDSIDSIVSPYVAPLLHNIGIMLPYTGLHYMLFEENDALIMTSANMPGEPMIIDNNEAIKRLKDKVDYILLHNRRIVQRCDDSVVRVVAGKSTIIRRSRGYVPLPIKINFRNKKNILAFGAEINTNICILSKDKAYLSQYIGNTTKYETLRFLLDTVNHLQKLTNVDKFDAIACDLHPGFDTTHLAEERSEKEKAPLYRIQHHFAHALSLMQEHNVDEMIAITCDGLGYGDDDTLWGGEILYCTTRSNAYYERAGHLIEQPMVGGDLSTKYPLRMVAGILSDEPGIEEYLFGKSQYFPHGEEEIKLILSQLKKKKYPVTSSCGRVLDAVSALLGICYERTYEGEPAMKLESFAYNGKDVLKLEPKTKQGIIDTKYLLSEIFIHLNKEKSATNLATSAHAYLARSLAEVAIEKAEHYGVKHIGFTGGCAYNDYLTSTIKKIVEKTDFNFLQHENVPAGDGGISFGQVIATALQEN
jgi:hydrogenase maturation protein HypF